MRAAHTLRSHGLQALTAISKRHAELGLATCCGGSASAALTTRAEATLACEQIVVPAPGQVEDDQLSLGIVVHGLLGTGRNWRTFVRSLAKQAAAESGRGWRIALVDLRNHGHTADLAGFYPPHTLQTAAQDLVHFVQQKFGGQQLNIIAGHSLGGKTTLEFLKQVSQSSSPVKPPQQTWILDANIGEVVLDKDAPSDVDKIIKEIKGLLPPIASREWLYKYMEDQGYSTGLRLWMGSNLVPDGQGKYKWGFNIEGADDMYESYRKNSYWDLIKAPPQNSILNIVRAAKSDRWTKQTLSKLEAAQQFAAQKHPGHLRVHTLRDAGHWVHVDNPHGLMDMMLPSFVNPQK